MVTAQKTINNIKNTSANKSHRRLNKKRVNIVPDDPVVEKSELEKALDVIQELKQQINKKEIECLRRGPA